MKQTVRNVGFRLVLALFGFACCAVPQLRAQQPLPPIAPVPADLDARLKKLEELNQKLEQQNTRLAAQNEQLAKQAQVVQPTGAAADPAVKGSAEAPSAAKKQEEAQAYEVGSDLNLKTTWKDGFNAETANQDFRIHIGGKFQNDYGFFAPDTNLRKAFPTGTPFAPGPGPNAWNDGADLRRTRLRADGTLFEVVDFVFEYEFAQTQQVSSSGATLATVSATGPTDAYVDVKDIPYLGRVRLGHFKEPFSLEDYGTSDVYLTFLERSSANDAFSPNRNFGGMVWNDPFEQRVVYGVGLFKENTNTNIGNAFDYGTGAWAATARLGFNPWYENDGACVLYFGGAYSFRRYDSSSALDRYRYASRIPIRVGSPILLDTGSLIADDSQLFNAQFAAVYGGFSVQAEYYSSQGEGVTRTALAPGVPRVFNPLLEGAYVQASLFLTGEHRNYVREIGGFGRIRPLEPFYLVPRGGLGSGQGSCFGKGAWELAARFDYLDLNSAAFGAIPATRGVAGSSAGVIPTTGFERDVLLGVNWYLNPDVKIQWNYTHAVRDVATPGLSGAVDAFAMRLTLDF